MSNLEQGLYESSIITAWRTATKERSFSQANLILMGYEWGLQDHAHSGEPVADRLRERLTEVRFLRDLLYYMRTHQEPTPPTGPENRLVSD